MVVGQDNTIGAFHGYLLQVSLFGPGVSAG
jgi:hypothetical protein